jgi:histidine ammonia-lyase
VTAAIMLRPGFATLAEWRAIYRGAPVALDPVSRPDVEAGAVALAAILERGGPAATESDHAPAEPVSPGDILPPAVARLIVALKAATLARGLLGVRWELVGALTARLTNGAAPALPAGGDRDILAALAADLSATWPGDQPADPRCEAERAAVSAGTAPSIAFGLAGLFEAERVAQSALVTGALFGAAAGAGEIPPCRIRRARRQPGMIAVAATLRDLVPSDTPHGPRASTDEALSASGQARAIGACLDLLRHAGAALVDEANSVTEERLIFWQSGELLETDRYGGEGTAFAADMVALSLARIAALAARRIAHLFASDLLSQPAEEGAPPAGTLSLRSTAASLAAEIRERARPAALRTDPEDCGDGAAAHSSARRLLPIAGNVTLLLAIELMAAAEALDRAERKASQPLERVRDLLRSRTGAAGRQALAAPDLAAAADLVRSGAVAAACRVPLPTIAPAARRPFERHLGDRANRT